MSIISIEEILDKLSTRFNKIFYDREFICSVQEDFEIILKNSQKCCVVIFPVLGPNYLKAVQYQAKIFNLAAFTLGTDKISSVAVCHKDFLIKRVDLRPNINHHMMPQNDTESNSNKLRKKRPERQLYVPPAQRISILKNEVSLQNKLRKSADRKVLIKKRTDLPPKKQVVQENTRDNILFDDNNSVQDSAADLEDIDKNLLLTETNGFVAPKDCNSLMWNDYFALFWNYDICENNKVLKSKCISKLQRNIVFKHYSNIFNQVLYKIPLFSNVSGWKLFILNKDILLWLPKLNISLDYNISDFSYKIYSLNVFVNSIIKVIDSDILTRIPLIVSNANKTFIETLDTPDISCYSDVVWVKKECFSKGDIFNILGSDYYCFINYECHREEMLVENVLANINLADDEIESLDNLDNTIKPESEIVIPLAISENSESPIVNLSIGQHNNNRNSISNSNVSDQKCINEKIIEKRSVHDEEKEIMRKTKENINRKTRPIMKYVDDTNNTLNIGKDDNVNNWEDLFDDQGQLHEELIKEIIHKVGTEVTIVKAKEDYSDYCVKQIEELEHMVELYDFPASLETNDLIHAFREINSDAMYIKWVDNTHAILVLGSLTQAQKAIGISNPLIKVRPMTAASSVSLATAYKHELKPAMKRPQTNLQTARRLITTHLGAKSTVSREKSAKERDVLREARELKKQLKKNEQDAWEGNLRSSLH